MGCDGGTIPKRDELVKTKQKPEQKDKDAERLYRWKHCAVSQTKLKHPIVACELGRMYNKEEVICRLLDKSQEPTMEHIRSLKDIKEMTLTQNPSYVDDTPNGDGYIDSQMAEYICPVSSQEMNGKSRFSIVWSCGCVVSDKAFKEVKSSNCHVCNKPFLMDDVIPINPPEDEIPKLYFKMKERRTRAKAAKKEQKESKRVADVELGSEQRVKKKKKLVHINAGASRSALQASVVSAVATTVLRSKELEYIRSSKFTVAGDPKKSEVYKSIFDTHKSAQGKATSHWVTCNPQYF